MLFNNFQHIKSLKWHMGGIITKFDDESEGERSEPQHSSRFSRLYESSFRARTQMCVFDSYLAEN